MENEELVRLAIWAGFTKHNIGTDCKESWRDEEGLDHEQDMRIDVWHYPDGTDSLDHVTDDNTVDRLPDFFNSLDHCFEWLLLALHRHFVAKGERKLIPQSKHKKYEWAKIELCQFLREWVTK